ncbi:MAG: LVIVD repeat-containing protein [Candidatus Heimdallarchaeota archaeon]
MRVKITNIFGILLVGILFLSLQNFSLYTQGKDSSFEEQNMEAQVDYSIIGQHDDNYGVPEEIIFQDDVAYIASGDGLLILDVADPTSPEHLGFYNSPGIVNDVVLENGYAYLATENIGLEVINITDLINPFRQYVCSINEEIKGLYLEQNYAYLACEIVDLIIVNITDLANMEVLGTFDDPNDNPFDPWMSINGRAQDVFVRNDVAIVADGEDGLNIINVLDPNNPVLLDKHENSSETYDFQVVDDLLYTTNYEYGFSIFNISNMVSPEFLSRYHYNVHYNFPQNLYVVDEIVYVAHKGYNYTSLDDAIGGLELVNASDPYNPIHIEKILLYKDMLEVFVYNGDAYLYEEDKSILIVDISNVSYPTKAVYNLGGTAKGLVYKNKCVFIHDYQSGFEIIDVSTPTNPVELGQLASYNYYDRLTVSNDYFFARVYDPYISIDCDLLTINIQDLNNPTIEEAHTDTNVFRIQATDSELYSCAGELRSYEIASPYDLNLLDTVSTYGPFIISGDEIFLMNYDGELVLIDISDPANLQSQISGTFTTQMSSTKKIVYGNNVVAFLQNDLMLIDVSDRSNPTLVHTILDDTEEFYDVMIYKNYLFGITKTLGYPDDIIVYDISDPSNPLQILTIDSGCYQDFHFDGSYLYASAGFSGLQIIQINGLVFPTTEIDIDSMFTLVTFGPILLIITWIIRTRKSKKR